MAACARSRRSCSRRRCAITVQKLYLFHRLGLALSESRCLGLLEILIVRNIRWSCWSRKPRLEGRRSIQLSCGRSADSLDFSAFSQFISTIFMILYSCHLERRHPPNCQQHRNTNGCDPLSIAIARTFVLCCDPGVVYWLPVMFDWNAKVQGKRASLN